MAPKCIEPQTARGPWSFSLTSAQQARGLYHLAMTISFLVPILLDVHAQLYMSCKIGLIRFNAAPI